MAELWSPRIANNPEAFVMFAYPWGQTGTPLENFKGPRKWQRRVLREMASHIAANEPRQAYEVYRKAISSGRGIGKSALVSWITNWFMTTRIGGTVIISANSEAQLRSVTWAELTKWTMMLINSHWWEISATRLMPAKWLTEIVERDLKKGTRYWSAEGRLWSAENPDSYAGVHNFDGVMVIFDEASGIPDTIWSVATGFFTENTPNRFWVAFSNPRRNQGYFFECFHAKREFWDTETVDARTVEGTDQQLYQQIIAEYGPDSVQAHVEVYGMFPPEDDDIFISMHLVEDAASREPYKDLSAPIIVGVDPARSGADSTVIVIRQGRDILDIKRYSGDDTMVTVGHVIEVIEEWQPAMVCVDEGGLGAGVLDRLKEQRYKVRGVNFGWAARNNKAWGNKRAEMWADMKDWLKTASIPNDRRLKSDLMGPTKKPNSSGVIFLEGKKEMRSRGMASPDTADALCVTFAFPVGNRQEKRGVPQFYNPSTINTSWMGS
jgi:hypothetical protein